MSGESTNNRKNICDVLKTIFFVKCSMLQWQELSPKAKKLNEVFVVFEKIGILVGCLHKESVPKIIKEK